MLLQIHFCYSPELLQWGKPSQNHHFYEWYKQSSNLGSLLIDVYSGLPSIDLIHPHEGTCLGLLSVQRLSCHFRLPQILVEAFCLGRAQKTPEESIKKCSTKIGLREKL